MYIMCGVGDSYFIIIIVYKNYIKSTIELSLLQKVHPICILVYSRGKILSKKTNVYF